MNNLKKLLTSLLLGVALLFVSLAVLRGLTPPALATTDTVNTNGNSLLHEAVLVANSNITPTNCLGTGPCAIDTHDLPDDYALAIRKFAPATATANSLITYTLVITNRGNLTATNLTITDVTPAGTTLVDNGDASEDDDTLSWELPELGINQSISRQFVVQALTQSVVNKTYRVSGDRDDDDDDEEDYFAVYNEAVVTIIPQQGASSSILQQSQQLGTLNSRGVALADLNKDGFPDLFVANASPNALYLNDGNGNLTTSLQNLGDLTSQAVALADLDGDGDQDAVVGNAAGQPNQVWLNDGQGTFNLSAVASLGSSNAQAIALGDVDSDGDMDVVVATGAGEAGEIWLNDSEGVFTAGPAGLPTANSVGVVLGNLDSTPGLDVALANNNSASQVFLNSGGGQFTAGPTLGAAGSQSIALGDVNNNGTQDIIIATGSNQQVWLNNGSGAFNNSGTFGSGSQAVALADLNNDGFADVVAAGADGGNQVWLGNGSGAFSLNQTVGSGNGQAISLNDLNLDGDLDVVIGNSQGNSILLNQNFAQGSFTPGTPAVLSFGDGLTLTITIPADALGQPTTFNYTPLGQPSPPLSEVLTFAGRAFVLTTTNGLTQFNPSITVTVYLPPAVQSNDQVKLYRRNTNKNPAVWEDTATTCTPVSTYTVTTNFIAVAICHLTEFALFVPVDGGDIFLPIILKK